MFLVIFCKTAMESSGSMAFSLAVDRSLGYNLDKEIGVNLVSIRPRS